MPDLSEFHFLRVYFLLLIPVLFWIIWRVSQLAKYSNAWTKACDPNLLSYLLVGVEKKKSSVHLFLLGIVGLLLIISAAGPTWKKLPQAVYKKESAKVFVLDLSRSMDSTDIAPSRTSRAKLKLIDFLEADSEGQSALIVYANLPHVVSPLTDDSNTIISMVPSLSTAIMPSGGGNADRAIIKAAQLLRQAGNIDGNIVLLTDGISLEASLKAAEKVKQMGYKLNVVGIGTEDGAPIPVGSGGFLKDASGNIVIPKLRKQALKELALAGGGHYSDIAVDDSDIEKLFRADFSGETFKDDPTMREVDLWRDEGHWFLLLALPFAALSFRRGWLGGVLVVMFLAPPEQAYALTWDDLWKNKNQQAQEKLDSGDAETAAELFTDEQWKGTAHYKNNNFKKAAEFFSDKDDAESYYNLGNALARQGDFDGAIEAYNSTLEREPNHKDAEFNKALVQKLAEQEKQNQEQQNQEQQNQDQQDQDNQDSDGDNESQSQQEQNQQNNENENQSDQKDGSQDQEQQDSKDDNTDAQENKDKDDENAEEREMAQQKEEDKDGEEEAKKQSEAEQEDSPEQKELKQATEQWLRRIPDDPGGLLREKMRRQSMRDRQRQRPSTENQW